MANDKVSGFAEQYRQLSDAFDALPGVGPRAAARMARYLFQPGCAEPLARLLTQAQHTIRCCSGCQMYTITELCEQCSASDTGSPLLVVEQPDDWLRWRDAGFDGVIFVLHGLLSPTAAIGPRQLGLALLKSRAEAKTATEIWLQLDQSVEASATEMFIRQMMGVTPVLRKTEAQLALYCGQPDQCSTQESD